MNDHYQYNHRNSSSSLKRVKWFAIGLFIALPIVVTLILFGGSLFLAKDSGSSTSSVQTKVQAPSTRVFRTAFFQFQATNTWTEDAKATDDNMFVYRSYRGPLIEHDLTIYVNPPSQDFDSVRIQPVIPEDDGTFSVEGEISDHCDSLLPDDQKDKEQTVVQNDVTYRCDADETIFEVLVGKVGGSPFIDMVRPSGETTRFVIKYRDLTAQPTGRELREIVRSFQTR